MGAAAAAPPISARTTAPSPIRPIISAPPAVTPTNPLKLLTIQHIEHRAAEAEKSSLLGPVLQLAQLGAPVGRENAVGGVGKEHPPTDKQVREGHRLRRGILSQRLRMTPGFVGTTGAH